MNQRGRKGENVVALPGCEAALKPGELAEPPKGLSEDERAVWRSVIASKPADWFTPDVYPLLADYCTACV